MDIHPRNDYENQMYSLIIPELWDLIGKCHSKIKEENFFQCESELQAIYRNNLISEQINKFMIFYLEDQKKRLGIFTGDTLIIFSSQEFSITVTKINSPPEFLYLHPAHIIGTPLCGSEVFISKYETTSQVNIDEYDREATLRLSEERLFLGGDIFTRNGLSESIDYRNNKDDDKCYILRITTKSLKALEWSFDRTTLRPWSSMAVSPISSQLCSLMDAVGAFKNTDSLSALTELSKHRDHFVRWKALQNIGKIDNTQAKKILNTFLHDEHSHIRHAASRELSKT
ncbi:HEAT repeat domain-containing protein [Asaia sp. BMEF1]|uniref:HEAT repeat domain-containing protein n=1 Tax=Asaia sp. BMEF1 TaxID=3155932 RepID=UPI003F662D6E